MPYRVGYIGNFYKVPEYIFQNESFNLVKIICENKKLDHKLTTFSLVREIELESVENRDELIYALNRTSVDFWIMCSFGRLIPTSRIKQKIYNIHYAMLPYYKGRHPTFWATVKGEKKVGITIHVASEKLDEGIIISQKNIPYYIWMDESSLFEELTKQIPLLLNDFLKYIKSDTITTPNESGYYFKPVSEDDITIHLQQDSCAEIYHKVRAQSKYKGAKLLYHHAIYWIKKIEFAWTGRELPQENVCIIPYNKQIQMILLEYEKEIIDE